MDKKIEDFFEIIKETVIDAEENGKPSGFKDGELCAYHCYEESMTDQTTVEGREIIECRKLPPIKDSAEFIDLLHEAGVTEIAITDNTDLISFLHGADGMCCKIGGVCTVARRLNNDEPPEEVQGILLLL